MKNMLDIALVILAFSIAVVVAELYLIRDRSKKSIEDQYKEFGIWKVNLPSVPESKIAKVSNPVEVTSISDEDRSRLTSRLRKRQKKRRRRKRRKLINA